MLEIIRPITRDHSNWRMKRLALKEVIDQLIAVAT